MTSLSLAPLLPLPVLLALMGLFCLVTAIGFYKSLAGRWYRLLATLVLAASLFDPQLVFEDREPMPDRALVLVDRSASQFLAQRKEQTDAALTALLDRLKALPRLETRVQEVNGSGEDGTFLFKALEQSLADTPADRLAGVFFITDGQVHDLPARKDRPVINAPLHTLITGHEKEHDRRVVLLDSPRFGLVGKEQILRFRIEETGGTGKPLKAWVRRDGVLVAEGRLSPQEEIKFPVTIDHAGTNLFEIEIEAAPTELTAANNRAIVSIEGIREALRVLLVSGQPHIGERVWRNLLKADQSVDLIHFTILRPPEKQDGTPLNELSLIAFPTRDLFETRINQFDLIIFDRYTHLSILPAAYLNNIVRHVRAGGALLVAAGPEFRGRQGLGSGPLSAILPALPTGTVFEKPFLPRVTALGQRHPVTRALPDDGTKPPDWAAWLRLIDVQAKAGIPVMSDGEGRPLLLLAHEEKGRVALLLSDHIWLWARNVRSGGPYLELLRPVVHWLMKEPDLEEEALRLKAQNGQLSIERQTLGDTASPVTLTTPAGQQQSLTLEASGAGLWRRSVPVIDWGLYQVKDGALTAFAHVGPANPREWAQVVSTPVLLTPISAATGGGLRRIGQADSTVITLPVILRSGSPNRYASDDTLALKDNNASRLNAISIKPLFGGWHCLLLLTLSLVLAWWAEGGFRKPYGGKA